MFNKYYRDQTDMFLLCAGLTKCLMPYTFLQITGLCKLLNQNSESLTSLEFIHCTLSSATIYHSFYHSKL
ncbi:hypothetical protein RchiOBHm_Chr5g0034531 [Rosa chinensis]|uniref:Uncharacterized protein n=1 Tax=Rosa chinensis TaxID=74649 RepID=A0A2P6QAZ4_ROSCH|nr:hypothetical protein RchiOBHm_Chr5g0034531 [Rosa chinensis]